jgi:hypothetical protein
LSLLIILLAIHKYTKLFWLYSRWMGCGEGRWASTHANRSNARLRLKTLPSIGRSSRSSFFKKPKILVAPSISMFKKIYCRF